MRIDRTGIALDQALFTGNSFELGKAADRLRKPFTRIMAQVLLSGLHNREMEGLRPRSSSCTAEEPS
ncbi:MAG TPA: hypothetical protein PLT09_04680 [Deltaproteobacteria bacterium]|nr:hypothetical protein [Deltaproteobacteria bacterium]HPR53911.1 hypothetical protein [Deltaproteobacteria bacterium]HXK46711.1 hypothetical protein [Deltaproteobacteria bacterium]